MRSEPVPILLLAQALGQGGSERQLAETAQALDRSRFAVHVGCLRAGGFRSNELRRAGIPVAHFPVYSFRSLGALRGAWQLGRYLRRHSIRLVHTFDTPTNCFVAPVARAFRTPVVISSQRASRRLSAPWEQSVLRFTDHLVDATVVNCEYVRRHMREDEGVRPERIYICYNGLKTGRFEPGPRQRTPVLADASLVIGVICALRPEKGLPTLVEAFQKVAAGPPSPLRSGLKLLIVGSGPMREPVEELCVKLGLRSRCHFEPSAPDVVPWLRSTDIFVLPSLSEALSNSLMEAMACGCTAVASRVGGNPELICEGATGLLFEAGNATDLARRLESLLADEELRSRFSAAASASIHGRFSIEASAKRMEEIYTELLERKL